MDEIRALVSAVAACAVGVDPTARMYGSITAFSPNLFLATNAILAASFTASTSVDKKAEAFSKDFEPYDCPA